jgi:hypothetical protein
MAMPEQGMLVGIWLPMAMPGICAAWAWLPMEAGLGMVGIGIGMGIWLPMAMPGLRAELGMVGIGARGTGMGMLLPMAMPAICAA